MPLQSDKQFKASWPANTTPQAPDGSGNTAKTLAGYCLTNAANAARCVKFYDNGSAPTVGTDTPTRTIVVPASGHVALSFDRGILFTKGLWVTVTVNPADADNTAASNNDMLVTVDYQN